MQTDSSSPDRGSPSGHFRSRSWDGHSTSDTSDVAANIKVKVNVPLPPTAAVNTYSFPKNHKLHNPNEDHYVFDNITPLEFMNQYPGPDLTQDLDKTSRKEITDLVDSCKEVEVSIEKHETNDIDNAHDQPALEDVSETKSTSLTRSTSCSAVIEGDVSTSTSPPICENNFVVESRSESDIKKLCRQDSQRSATRVDEKEMQHGEEDIIVLSPLSKTKHENVMVSIRGVQCV